ncbi:MarR family winged helix-turn-helix transcriptional regulator [Microbacterium sp. 3J1]|uniref:MarR family winged helix-turn-helix transcriptional regulator n=1 Tax=Microbacterium sp. 3J1 TaxID=861269 RepID=UPI000B18345F|nr:MarR family winged helix-turn-helix transcriptional regulator [Microbacterium sp. 3J1]
MSDEYDLRPDSPFALLSPNEVSAWFAYMKVHLRISYEMNRQLRVDSGISLGDFDVLVALTSDPHGRMTVSGLATRIGWERSRLSHHLRRMRASGLVETSQSTSDRRVTEVVLTEAGSQKLREASPSHIGFVQRAFFGDLAPAEIAALTSTLEKVYDGLIEHGSLPRPEDHP